jgi:hypothetical protein
LKVLERRGEKCGRKVEKWAGKRKEEEGRGRKRRV